MTFKIAKIILGSFSLFTVILERYMEIDVVFSTYPFPLEKIACRSNLDVISKKIRERSCTYG